MTGILTKRTERFAETEIDDEVVVMDLEKGDFFSFRDTALEIWRLADGTRDQAGIVTALAQDFDVTESMIAADVAAFLEQVMAAGLLAAD